MPIILFNFSWMFFNCILAILPVVFGYIFLRTRNKPLKVLTGILWLLFLPNTIYLFTDMIHILYQWDRVAGFDKVIVALQFIGLQIVGFVTFILAFRPFEVIVREFTKNKKKKMWAIIIFNFIIALGIVLGRVERINSWDVFFATEKAIQSLAHVLTSTELLGLTILFGLFCNFFYFLFRDFIFRSAIKVKKSLAK